MSLPKEISVSQSETRKLACLLDECREAFMILSAGIHRDRKKNLCWIHGEAAAVHVVEHCLKKIDRYIYGEK